MACGTYFYPRPPRGGRQIVSALAFTCNIISIHALREEGDPPCAAGRGSLWNFYPRPPRGGRQLDGLPVCSAVRFLSTPSARRATWTVTPQSRDRWEFLSTPSARRATTAHNVFCRCKAISIHALREEGDSSTTSILWSPSNFYPRPPRGGRLAQQNLWPVGQHFYPRPPRGGRQCHNKLLPGLHNISIHALREEGDGVAADAPIALLEFLSTPSARRAT